MPKIIIIIMLTLFGNSKATIAKSTVPASLYSFAPKGVALDRGLPIDLDLVNEAAFKALSSLNKKDIIFLIIPGYVSKGRKGPIPLDPVAKERLRMALVHFQENSELTFFIVSGGNVWPSGTPYNEAMEMRRYLMEEHKVNTDRILVEPHARNSVTNLRNVGRILRVIGAKEGKVITTPAQRMYYGLPMISSFGLRSILMLGGMPGHISYSGGEIVFFKPFERVFKMGGMTKDP